jgi:hypothetical protein
MARFKDPIVWLHGLFSAFIGGSVTVVADVVTDALMDGSVVLNLKKLGLKALVGGAVLAAAYLRKSPLPELEETK